MIQRFFQKILKISKILLFWTFWHFERASWANFTLTFFSIEGGDYQFSHVTSTNIGISPLKLSTFQLLCYTCLRSYLVSNPNYWTWTSSTPQKKRIFFSNLYKIKVMITSLIVMLELPNFFHMTTFTIWFDSPRKILLVAR